MGEISLHQVRFQALAEVDLRGLQVNLRATSSRLAKSGYQGRGNTRMLAAIHTRQGSGLSGCDPR